MMVFFTINIEMNLRPKLFIILFLEAFLLLIHNLINLKAKIVIVSIGF
jgi:hypothetical protein